MAARTFLVACLLVLAGCATPFAPSTPSPAEPTPTQTPDPAEASTPVESTATASRTVDVESNPWGEDPVVVAIRNDGNRDRDFAPMVRAATEFWEENGDRYLGFPTRYEVRPDAEDPDLVVAFADAVPDCGNVTDAAGCAPLLTDPRQVDRPETVWVKTGLGDASTTLVTKHELGHTLGLTHADPPSDVMQAQSVLYTESQPNATERSFPWADGDFTVRIDAENASDPDGARTQIGHALTYYEAGAPGMPDNLTFERVDAGDPEVLITFGSTGDCGASIGSCVDSYGTDPDGDGAIETYTRIEISLVGIDTDAVGWHVGYWLAHTLGAEADGEKPPPFRDASYRERRSEWWE